jgi:MFS family permease
MALSANRLFLIVVLGGQSMANIDTAIINVATPAIGASLGATGGELQLTVSTYILATATLLVTAARLGALYGYRRIFMAGLIAFTLASLGCGIAPNILTLIVMRVIQGAGASLMIAQVMSGIQRMFTGTERIAAIGAYTTTLSAGAVTGQILGGLLITLNLFGLTWRPLFLINVPLGIALFAVAWFVLPRDPAPVGVRPRLDLPGVALLSIAMLLLVLPLTVGREMGWPLWMIGLLIACVPFTAVFILWQQRLLARGGAPLLNVALFHEPMVVSGLVAQLFGRVTYFALLFILALYVQVGLGESALVSGLSLIGWVASYGVAGIVYPRIPHRITLLCGPIGGVMMAGAYAATAIASAVHLGMGIGLVAILAFGGFGWGMFSTAMTAQLAALVPVERAPDLSGVLATLQPLSAVIGIATFGSLYLILTPTPGAATATHAFALINAGFAVCALCAAGLSLSGPRAAQRLGREGVRALS